MDVIAISLGVVVAGAVGVYLARPWWAAQEATLESVDNANDAAATLHEQQDRILSALRDLDFDHQVGKVTAEDYSWLRQTLLAEAAMVLTQLDESRAAEADLDEQVEAQILAIRRSLKSERRGEEITRSSLPDNTCPTCRGPARPGDIYCAGCGTLLNAACPDCGTKVQAADRYCASCGIELALALSG